MEIQARKRVIVNFIISTPLLTKEGRFVERIVINIREGHSLSTKHYQFFIYKTQSSLH